MGCATGLVKSLMFVFNCLFVTAGLGLIIFGVLTYLKINTYESIVTPEFQIAPTLILILGVIVFLIAFFGCCGVIRESYCMLVTYAIILLTLFILQAAAGVYAYMQVDKDEGNVSPFIRKTMNDAITKYNENKEIREAFNIAQLEMRCCGVDSALDYVKIWANSSVPASCCKSYDGSPCSLVSVISLSPSYYMEGCASKLSRFINDNIEYVFYFCIAVAGVEIIGSIFALCLACSVKNDSRRRYP